MESLNHKKILVTGGAGFIGSHIVDELLRVYDRQDVAVLDNFSTGSSENLQNDISVYEVDLCDHRKIRKIVNEFRPTHIIHQAAQVSVPSSVSNPQHDANINILGSINLIEEARKHALQHIVFASSGGAIYGEVLSPQGVTESGISSPQTPYGVSKLSFEFYLRVYSHLYNIDYTSLRYSNVYGPRQNSQGEAGVIAIFIDKLFSETPVNIYAREVLEDNGGVRDYIYVTDVAQANVLAIQKRLTGIFNVSTGIGTSTLDIARLIQHTSKMDLDINYAPPRIGDIKVSIVNPQKLQSKGWGVKHTLKQGISESLRYFRNRKQSLVS